MSPDECNPPTGSVGFNYSEVEPPEAPDDRFEQAALMLTLLIQFINSGRTPTETALRSIVLSYEVRPDLSPFRSFEQIAAFFQKDFTRQYVHKLALEFRRLTNFVSTNQDHLKSDSKQCR